MPDRSCVLVVSDEHRAVVNSVLGAVGLGPDTITQPAAGGAGGPPTHWFAHSYNDQPTAEALLTYAEGTLPAIQYPWGMFDTPPEVDAIAAAAGLTVSVSSGEAIPTEHLEGILAGMGLVKVAA